MKALVQNSNERSWVPGVFKQKCNEPRSYLVEMSKGNLLRRNGSKKFNFTNNNDSGNDASVLQPTVETSVQPGGTETSLKDQTNLTYVRKHLFYNHRGMTAEEATCCVLEEQLPALKAAKDKGELRVDSIDVFCEYNVFDVEQSKRILQAGRKNGLLINFHAEELHPLKSAEVSVVRSIHKTLFAVTINPHYGNGDSD
ncbi:putative imidazolonepropionase [Halocaridina rubra]|uniref:Imidazolonepropionase n=1 Tax=Halocaridina rubra TaxID=373956 RepID=A0AAN9A443_HALRR